MTHPSISSIDISSHARRFKTLHLIALALLLLFLTSWADMAGGATVTLAWDPNTDFTVKGYKLYWGTQSGQFALLADVGNSTNEVVSSLQDGMTYYFTATAYDGEGNESTYSNQVSYSAAAACTYSISPASQTLTAGTSTGSISVITQPGCTWTAASGGSWMTVTSGASGTGSGTIGYSVSANTSSAIRVMGASVAGQVFTLTQKGSQDETTSTLNTPIGIADIQIAPASSSTLGSDYLDTVQKIYIGYYDRAADPAGLIYWAGRLSASNGNLKDIIEAFANSAESRALYGTTNGGTISTVVNRVYNALFGRDADSTGLNYYVDGFNTGKFTPATIMLDILYGAQNKDLQSVNNKLAAANLFTKTIDPDLDGTNLQVTYTGEGDATAARRLLSSVTWDAATVPKDETAYIAGNIAGAGDPILNEQSFK